MVHSLLCTFLLVSFCFFLGFCIAWILGITESDIMLNLNKHLVYGRLRGRVRTQTRDVVMVHELFTNS